MQKYKAIGFDYGGVLNNSKSALPGIAKMLAIPEIELRTIYYSQNYLAGINSMSYEDLWCKIATEAGHEDKCAAIIDHIHTQWDYTIRRDMLNLVDTIKKRGYKVGLLSNNTREIGDSLRLLNLDKHFDVFLISAEMGCQKPSQEAFNIFCKELQVAPHELVFIDNSESSLRLSGEIGYHPILFKGYEELITELTNLEIL